MVRWLAILVRTLGSTIRTQRELALENLALRQQVGVVWIVGPAAAQTTSDKMENKAERAKDKVEDKAERAKDKTESKTESTMDKVKEKDSEAKDEMVETKDKVVDKVKGK